MEYIKRCFFAKRICENLGAKYTTVCSLSRGSYSMRTSTDPNTGLVSAHNKVIEVSVFNTYFYEVLAHELGHLMDHRVRGFTLYNDRCTILTLVPPHITYSNSGDQVNGTLYTELRASRCARLLLRSWGRLEDDSMKYLTKCYFTYLKKYPNHLVADVAHNGFKYLMGKK